MRIVEKLAVSGEQDQVLVAGGGGENAVCGIWVETARQGVSLFHDLEGDGFDIPPIRFDRFAEPGFPVDGQFDAASFLQAGEFGAGNRRNKNPLGIAD